MVAVLAVQIIVYVCFSLTGLTFGKCVSSCIESLFFDAVDDFAIAQGHKGAAIHSDSRLYSSLQLSGAPLTYTDGYIPPVRLVLIPSGYTYWLGLAGVAKQNAYFGQFRADQAKIHPGIVLKTPSVLDVVAWWYMLREELWEASGDRGKKLRSADFDMGFVSTRHIDLAVYRDTVVPSSQILADGLPVLSSVQVGSLAQGRVEIV